PPEVSSEFHGLRHMPLSSEEVIELQNSGRFVLPSTTKPPSRKRRTIALSLAATLLRNALHECVVGMPATSMTSLTDKATPWNGGRSIASDDRTDASAASAPTRAKSSRKVT